MTALNTAHHRGGFVHRAKAADLDGKLTAFCHFQCETWFVLTHCLSFWTENLSSPASGSTVAAAVTFGIGQNGSKIAYFSHSAGIAHGAPPPQVVVVGLCECKVPSGAPAHITDMHTPPESSHNSQRDVRCTSHTLGLPPCSCSCCLLGEAAAGQARQRHINEVCRGPHLEG